MAKPKVNPILDLIRSSPAQKREVESWLMYALIHDYDFWLLCLERLCKDPETETEIDDFEELNHNIIFKALRRFSSLGHSDTDKDFTPSIEGMRSILQLEADHARLCTAEEIPGLIELYSKYKLDPDSGRTWAKSARNLFAPWLSIARANHVSTGLDNHTLDEMIASAERQSDAVSTTEDDDIVVYGKQKRVSKPKNSVALTGFPMLSQKLGNFRYGNGYLFQAPSGGGKTVLACQLVHEFVSQGLKGVMITTEQGFDELEPRFVSLACSIPIYHAGLNMGVEEELLKRDKNDPSIYTRFREWEQMAKNMFVVYPWENDNSQSIHTDMEATIRRVTKLLGCPPQFVILDWIGGALGSDVAPENLRIAYQMAANAFAASAKKHKYIGCAFAQTVGNKHLFKLDASTLAECKTMHTKYCSLIGITAIETLGKDGEVTPSKNPSKNNSQNGQNVLVKDVYRDEQFLDVSKARFGKPGRIAIKREFHFQRFKELKDIDMRGP